MKIFNKKLLLILLIILVTFSIIILKPDKKVILDSVQVLDNTNNKFAIQYQVNGEYKEIDKFLGKEDGYILNTELSKCQNEEGKELDNNIINYDNQNKTLTVDTKTTSYCYLFFDEEENLKNLCKESNLSECMTSNSDKLESINNLNAEQAGMYRYQGSNTEVNNNYICFGTNDNQECISNEDKYMYRIIGITKDGKLELIKKTIVSKTQSKWNNLASSSWSEDINQVNKLVDAEVSWNESDLFKRLNGLSSNNDNLFIGNNTYDYLDENSDWYKKIADNEWLNVSLSGDSSNFQIPTIYKIETGQIGANYYEEADPYYYNGGTDVINNGIYEERRRQDDVECGMYYNKILCRKTVYKFPYEKFSAKIGLMHIYEFDYSIQKDGLDCLYGNIYDYEQSKYKDEINLCRSSWMHITNNNIASTGTEIYDWTMSRYGYGINYNSFFIWYVHSLGCVDTAHITSPHAARPVFYLINTISIKSGNGSINNPYIIN